MKKSLCADQRYCHFTNPISILHLTDTDNNYYNRNNTKNANANANTQLEMIVISEYMCDFTSKV